MEAGARVSGSDTGATTTVSMTFTYGVSDVVLDIHPDKEELGSVPATAQELFDGAWENELLEVVVRYAEERPVLERQNPAHRAAEPLCRTPRTAAPGAGLPGRAWTHTRDHGY
jgi:hypothetical protein